MIVVAGLTPAWQSILRFTKLEMGEVNRAAEVLRCGSGKVLNVGLALAALPLVPRRARAAGEITFMTWVGYDTPEAMPAYVAKYGGTPDFTIFGEEEEGQARLRQRCGVVLECWSRRSSAGA